MGKHKVLQEVSSNQAKPVQAQSWVDREEDEAAPMFTPKLQETNHSHSIKTKHTGCHESNCPSAGNILIYCI